MTQTHSPKFLQKRKLFTALPVLVLPFVTLFFWALGIAGAQTEKPEVVPRGFNFNLPDANLENKDPLDKLGFYEKAHQDSMRLADLIKNDPYYRSQNDTLFKGPDSSKLLGLATKGPGYGTITLPVSPYRPASPEEAQVYQKLSKLTASLNAATDEQVNREPIEEDAPFPTAKGPDLAKLEDLMRGMNSGAGTQPDPELDQLSGMLEKVLDIQHPERVEQRLKQTSLQNRGKVYPVTASEKQTPITSLAGSDAEADAPAANGFFGLNEGAIPETDRPSVAAVVHENQELVSGATIKLRLTDDIFINGVLIPKGSFVFGTASLDGDRLKVQVNSVRYQNSLFPVALAVFDMDGMAGIHVPGAITRDAAKQGADRAIQSIGMTSFDQSIGAQAASAGIEITRNLLGRKVRQIKVFVKAGYQVLLRDDKQTDN